MPLPIYRGFSTIGLTSMETNLTNMDLVKQDLLNEFMTRQGERVGRPEFGSVIWDLLFDQGDSTTESLIEKDAKRIVNNDPRVTTDSVTVDFDEDAGSITVTILLYYVEYEMSENFTVAFESES